MMKMMYAYIGCRTTKKRYACGKGISCYKIDEKGQWELQGITQTLDNPSFLVFDRTKTYLYAVHGDMQKLSAFRKEADGSLTWLQTVAVGQNPVYATPTVNNKFLFVASLQGGCVTSFPIQQDGMLGAPVTIATLEGSGPNKVSYAHACVLDRTGRYLLVPSQARGVGYDRVWVFQVDQENGSLTLVSWTEARKYDEPRHIVLSPDNKMAYLVNEKGNTLRVFDFDENTGHLTARQVVPSLQDTYVGPSMASAILMEPQGRMIYVSNRIKEGIPPEGEGPDVAPFRGQETIVSYEIDQTTGLLKNPEFVNCEGYTPRFMTLTPDGRQLICANMDSHTLKFFAINETTGRLQYTGQTIATESPTCVTFVEL